MITSVPVFWLVNKDLRECFHKPLKHFRKKKTKALKRQYYLIICEQPSLLLSRLHPKPAGADVVRGLPATKNIIQEIKSSHSACNQNHYSRTIKSKVVTRTNKQIVVTVPALRAGADDLVLELLGLPPLADARQAEAVRAVGKDTKPAQSGTLKDW